MAKHDKEICRYKIQLIITIQNNTIQFRLLARLRKLGPQLTQPQLRPLHNTLEFGKLAIYKKHI